VFPFTDDGSGIPPAVYRQQPLIFINSGLTAVGLA
jgi:hypothetical protein